MGFFNLAIAAPSMKAALEAWGTKNNLFHLEFATPPALTMPSLGVASATSINKVALTAPATSALPDGVTLTGPFVRHRHDAQEYRDRQGRENLRLVGCGWAAPDCRNDLGLNDPGRNRNGVRNAHTPGGDGHWGLSRRRARAAGVAAVSPQ